MTDSFNTKLGQLPAADAAAYEQAIDLYRALLALLNARADHEPDPAAAARLRADAVRYAAEQRQLRATDHAAVERVVRQYPAIVREQRAALAE